MTQESKRVENQKVVRPKPVPVQPVRQPEPLTMQAIQTKLDDPATVLQMQRELGNQAVSRYVLQRMASEDAFSVDDELSSQITSQIGSGTPIGADPVANNVSALTGVDVSDTKVHRDSDLPAQVGAKAMAVGDTVFFGKGHDSAETVGHELAHIAQNKTGNAPQVQASGLEVTAANSSYEDYADSVGAAATKSSSQVANLASAGDLALATGPVQREDDLQLSRLQRQDVEEEEMQASRLQRMEEEEEMMQMQRMEEEEEMMQMQRMEEEEETMQMQREGAEEEELMQG